MHFSWAAMVLKKIVQLAHKFPPKNLIYFINCIVDFYCVAFLLPPTIVNNCNCYKLCLLHILRIRRIAHTFNDS